MLRMFCEAEEEQEQTEEFEYPILTHSKIAARIRHDIDVYGYCNANDALAICDFDQLTNAELKYLRGRLRDSYE